MAVKAVFFDIDGTLVDSNDHHVISWEEAFAGVGKRFERQTIHDQIGKGADSLVPTLIPEADAEMSENMAKAHGHAFKSKHLHEVKPFPAARALLDRVHSSGALVVLASSASKAEVEHYLDLLDVRAIVSATTSADDVEHTKPAPDIFAMALKKVGLISPGEVIVVGDIPYDVEAASKCGIATIALRSGKFSDDALLQAGAAELHDDVAALLRDYDQSPLQRGLTR